MLANGSTLVNKRRSGTWRLSLSFICTCPFEFIPRTNNSLSSYQPSYPLYNIAWVAHVFIDSVWYSSHFSWYLVLLLIEFSLRSNAFLSLPSTTMMILFFCTRGLGFHIIDQALKLSLLAVACSLNPKPWTQCERLSYITIFFSDMLQTINYLVNVKRFLPPRLYIHGRLSPHNLEVIIQS